MSTDLSPKQERFCQLYAEGYSSTQAYKKAYINSNMSDNSAAASATRLLKNVKIRSRINQLRDEAAAPTIKTILQTQAFLSSVLDDEKAPTGSKIRAAEVLLKSQGVFDKENGISNNINLFSNDEDIVIYIPEMSDEKDCIYQENEEKEVKK